MANLQKQKLWTTLLICVGILAAFMASAIAGWIAQYDDLIVSSQAVCGVLLGQLIGLRRQTIMAFVVAPFCGLVAGIADIYAFILFYEHFNTSIGFVGMIPVWGLVFGLLVAAYQVDWRSSAMVLFLIAFADFLGRWGWAKAHEYDLQKTGEWPAIAESLVFVPTVVLAIWLTQQAKPTVKRDECLQTG